MDDTTPLDAEAMRRTAAGDLEAFGEIVCRHEKTLLNFFRRLGASPEDAEDWTQETFLRLYGWRDRYEPTARFAALLLTLARHVRIDRLRKAGRSLALQAAEDLADRAVDPAAGPERVGEAIDVRAALARLSEAHREVVVLAVFEGLGYAEIGAALGVPEGTVKSRMFHALRKLRGLLGEER